MWRDYIVKAAIVAGIGAYVVYGAYKSCTKKPSMSTSVLYVNSSNERTMGSAELEYRDENWLRDKVAEVSQHEDWNGEADYWRMLLQISQKDGHFVLATEGRTPFVAIVGPDYSDAWKNGVYPPVCDSIADQMKRLKSSNRAADGQYTRPTRKGEWAPGDDLFQDYLRPLPMVYPLCPFPFDAQLEVTDRELQKM